MNKMARRDFLRLAGLGAAAFACGPRAFGAPAGKLALVEAENFEKLGGWAIDQQFMDQMGSPYLLAHGLGEPVADATTSAMLPAAVVPMKLLVGASCFRSILLMPMMRAEIVSCSVTICRNSLAPQK